LLHTLQHLLNLLCAFGRLTFGFLLALLASFLASFLTSLTFTTSTLCFLLHHALLCIELINHQFHNHIFFEEVERSTLINCTLHCFFLLCSFYYTFLDSSLCDKLINIYISTLTDTMSSIGSLCVHSRVPIIIVENDSIGSSQCDTKPTYIIIKLPARVDSKNTKTLEVGFWKSLTISLLSAMLEAPSSLKNVYLRRFIKS